jgi:hypothetical protein
MFGPGDTNSSTDHAGQEGASTENLMASKRKIKQKHRLILMRPASLITYSTVHPKQLPTSFDRLSTLSERLNF